MSTHKKSMKKQLTEREKHLKDDYDRWREVPIEQAQYCIILRPASSDTSVLFYKSKVDAEWALKHSWFDEKTPTVARLLNTKLEIIDGSPTKTDKQTEDITSDKTDV